MNTNPHDPSHDSPLDSPLDSFDPGAFFSSAEETLRLIASLPAPEGLEIRIEAALRSAPKRGRILSWPEYFQPASFNIDRPWLRLAAAAAIAFVVVGGGWGVYSRVERQQAARVIVIPARGPAAGGFSNAGAIRTPQTLNGPVLAQPATPKPAQPKSKKKHRVQPKAKSGTDASGAMAPK